MLVLSIGVEISRMDDLDFEEEKIYGVEYWRCAMFMKHKKNIKCIYVEFQKFVFFELWNWR